MVWSRRQPLASVGAVLSLLDGPTGCDPAFCVVWFRFRLLRRYLALWPTEVEIVSEGGPGPLDFHGRERVVQSMYLPAALHGIEASFFASESLRKLRSAVRRVVWSRRQPLANVGAVLSLLDGPTGCDPFCVVWFRFRLLRRYLALWPTEVGGVYRLLEIVSEGGPGHGPIHLFSASAAEIGFWWDPLAFAWSRPGLPLLLCSILGLLFLMLGVIRLLLIFAVGRAFGVGFFWISMFLCSSLILLMFEKEIRHCFVPLWLVVS